MRADEGVNIVAVIGVLILGAAKPSFQAEVDASAGILRVQVIPTGAGRAAVPHIHIVRVDRSADHHHRDGVGACDQSREDKILDIIDAVGRVDNAARYAVNKDFSLTAGSRAAEAHVDPRSGKAETPHGPGPIDLQVDRAAALPVAVHEPILRHLAVRIAVVAHVGMVFFIADDGRV